MKCAEDLSEKYSSDHDIFEIISEVQCFKFQAISMFEDLEQASQIEFLQFIYIYSLKDYIFY